MKQVMGLALGLMVLFAGKAIAQDKGGNNDQTFVTKASSAGLAEVNFGQLAAKRASNADVKKFAEKMVEDHTKANKELTDLADNRKLKVASQMDDEHRKTLDKLGKLSGSEFDRLYMEGQVKDHEDAVALFEKQAKNGENTELKKWAEKTLPTLREHLKMAKDIHGKVKDGKGRSSPQR